MPRHNVKIILYLVQNCKLFFFIFYIIFTKNYMVILCIYCAISQTSYSHPCRAYMYFCLSFASHWNEFVLPYLRFTALKIETILNYDTLKSVSIAISTSYPGYLSLIQLCTLLCKFSFAFSSKLTTMSNRIFFSFSL